MNCILLRCGFPPIVIKSRERARYLAVIQASDAGDDQPMLEFIIDNLRWTLALCNKATVGLVPLESD